MWNFPLLAYVGDAVKTSPISFASRGQASSSVELFIWNTGTVHSNWLPDRSPC